MIYIALYQGNSGVSGITQNTQQAAAMLQRQMNMAVQQQPTQQTTGTTGI